MATEIDSLQIQITANAQKADTALDNLIKRLDTLTTSLTGLDGSNLTSFAGGVRDLGSSMQLFKSTKAVDFNKIARGIDKFSQIDSSSFTKISSGLVGLATGLGNISNVDNLGGIAKVVNAVKNLDSVDTSKFNTVAFDAIGVSIKNFASSLTTIGNVDKNTVSLVTAVSRLSASGKNIDNVSREFPTIATNIVDFITKLNGTNVSFDVGGLATLVGNIRNLGGKVATNAIINLPKLADAMVQLMTTLSKAPQVSSNVIQITTALANLSAQGSKVGNSARSIERGLNRASRSATRASFSFRSLASLFGTFYANAFLVIRGINGIKKAIDSTADYLEAYNYFNVALGKVGKDWAEQWTTYADEIGVSSAEEYADSFATRLKERLKSLSGLEINIDDSGAGLLTETGLQNLGLNIQEVTQYASQLASVTNSVGQVGEVSLATASSLTKLGADLSSLFNLDYSDVMANLQSGLIGQSRALYKYGIDITNATLQTYAYDLALNKSVSEMTQMEKMQLRLLAILDQSKVSWGDLANTINSPSNMMRQFSNNAKELGLVLGQLFIPALQKVMPVVNGATIALKRLLVGLANLLGIKLQLDDFGQGFTALEEDTDGLADSLDGVSKSANKAYMGLLGFDKLNVIKTPDDANKSKGSGVGGGTIDLTDEILEATEEYEKAWQDAFDQMENKAQDFADIIEKIFKPIADIIKEDFEDIEWEAISENIGDLSEALQPYAENFGKGLLDFFEDLGDISVTTINSLFGEDGAVTKLTDWLNKGDPEKAENWGYAFGVISTGLLGFAGLLGVANVLTLLAKGIGLFVSPLGKLIGLAKGSSAIAGLSTALTSLGGIGGLFTMDLGLIFGAGTAMEIGLTIGAGLIAGIIAAWAGFNFGKWLGEKLFPEDAEWYDNFSWFGEDGFFDSIGNAGLSNTLIAISDMATDILSIGSPLSSVFKMLHSNFEEIVRAVEEGGALAGVKEYFNQFVKNIETFGFSILDTIDTIKEWANSALDVASDFVEKLQNLFSDALFNIENMFGSTKFNFNIGGLGKIGDVGSGIKGFATGGFPEDGLFYANHTELVGKFSNGKTAVANNQQITDGIEEAAYRGMMRALSAQGGSANVNVTLEGDANRLFRVVRKEADTYLRTTGRPAF